MKTILIWTKKLDLHADLVIRELNKLDTQVIRINGDEYPNRHEASVYFPGGQVSQYDKHIYAYNKPPDSVWYRRRIAPSFSQILSPDARTFVIDEVRAWLDGILLCAREAYWVNNYEKAHLARNKIYQLAVAEKVGLRIPPTLISNDKRKVIEFAKQHKKIVYKPVYKGLVSRLEGPDQLIFTNVVDTEMIEAGEKEIRHAPGIFQAYIQKALELRITMVSNQIFACAIDSQRHKNTQIDWRHYNPNLQHSIFALPDTQKILLRRYMRAMGLEFGAIDMILTPDDQYIFLEVNQMGQWAWIQNETGMPIAQALANLLYSTKKGERS